MNRERAETPRMADENEMACRELAQLVTDYLDEHLTEHDRRRFEEHMAVCTSCVTLVAQFRTTIAVVSRLDADRVVPPATRDQLLAAFRAWTAAPPSGA